MMDTVEAVRDFYNGAVEGEWGRIAGRPEFLLTCRFIDRYVKPSEKVLDIGGGPGRYSLYLAAKGCDVTLLDLSPANVEFAKERAAEAGLAIKAASGDAREADIVVGGSFDHILLMGPMYHLLEEADRVKAVDASLKLLKTGGNLYISFINMLSGITFAMKCHPDMLSDPIGQAFYDAFIHEESYAGAAFTNAYFARQGEILPFMSRFPLEKLNFFGQEGITPPYESNIMSQSPEIIKFWLDLCDSERFSKS